MEVPVITLTVYPVSSAEHPEADQRVVDLHNEIIALACKRLGKRYRLVWFAGNEHHHVPLRRAAENVRAIRDAP